LIREAIDSATYVFNETEIVMVSDRDSRESGGHALTDKMISPFLTQLFCVRTSARQGRTSTPLWIAGRMDLKVALFPCRARMKALGKHPRPPGSCGMTLYKRRLLQGKHFKLPTKIR
jgi:hypothetical protein